MDSNIIITNSSSGSVHINIEGIIGVPETQQSLDRNVSTTYESFRQILERIAEIDSSDIVVDIRSTGGSVNDALLIHDAIVATGATVTTRCFGYVASAATIIAQAASQGLRQISSNALYLIHNSAMEAEGNAQKLTQTAELLDKTDQTIASIYATRSGHDVEEFVDLMAENNGDGRWLTPQEALDYGLVDSVFEKADSVEDVNNNSNGLISTLWNRLVSALGVGALKNDQAEELSVEKTMLEAQVEPEAEDVQIDHDGGMIDDEQVLQEQQEQQEQQQPVVQEDSNEESELFQVQDVVDGSLGCGAEDQAVVNAVEDGALAFRTEQALQDRALARASRTMSMEDPAIEESRGHIHSNTSAYYEDARNF